MSCTTAAPDRVASLVVLALSATTTAGCPKQRAQPPPVIDIEHRATSPQPTHCAGRVAQLSRWLAQLKRAAVGDPISRPKVLDRDPAFRRLRKLRADPVAAAQQLAKLWRERLHDRCPDARTITERVVGKDSAQRIDILASELPPALEMCNCRADLPAVRGLLYISLHTPPLGVE